MMKHPVEAEFKLQTTPEMLANLRVCPALRGAETHTRLVATYFDTATGHLSQKGAALRLRIEGEQRQQTFKLAVGDGSAVRRTEWNVPVGSDGPLDLTPFSAKARSALDRTLGDAELIECGKVQVERSVRRVRRGDSLIEVAFDAGEIEAGGRLEPICEVELELVEGRLADMADLALDLPLGPDLMWSVRSKAARCQSLAFDMPPSVVRAANARLDPALNAAQAFQAIAWSCLEHLLGNYPLIIASGDPEALHQTRVAIRRLRAAFSLFGEVAEDDISAGLKAGLNAAASELSPARDLQVIIEKLAASSHPAPADTTELLELLKDRRDAAVQSAQAVLRDRPFQRLLFELARWIEDGLWLTTQSTKPDKPLGSFAASVLARHRRKLLKRGIHLARMTDESRHRARIAAKKLRYAVEFFGSLYSGEEARDRHGFAKAVGSLQNELGELNDLAVADASGHAWFAGADPITAARLETQLADALGARCVSRRKLLKRAEKALKTIAEAPAWWNRA